MKKFLFNSLLGENKWMNSSWLVFRIYIGLSMALGAGLPKITAGLTAPDWFIKQVGEIGFTFPSPVFWATISSWGEFLGGILIAFGLFTRIAAIQLAFQFFVVAFVWYDNPMPILGMYYQQLLFWGYVLIAVAGAGTFSVDYWIARKKGSEKIIKSRVAVAIMAGIIFSTTAIAQTSPVIHPEELNNLRGSWKGRLTYKDYNSGNETAIPATVFCQRTNSESRTWVLNFDYPGENGHEHMEEYRINKEGTVISNQKLLEKIILPDGSLKILLEENGKDGNDQKPATFHHIIVVSASKLSITKMVRFEGELAFFKRNEYQFSRL